jgi:hypothetical protein
MNRVGHRDVRFHRPSKVCVAGGPPILGFEPPLQAGLGGLDLTHDMVEDRLHIWPKHEPDEALLRVGALEVDMMVQAGPVIDSGPALMIAPVRRHSPLR